MDHDTLQLIIGIIFLALIVNTIAIWSIATTNNPQTTNALTIDSSGSVSSKTSPGATVSPDPTKAATATPTVTPIITPSISSTKTLTPVPTQKSYVEFVAPTPVAIETHQQIQPNFLIRSEEGYKTIYSLNNSSVSEHMGYINITAEYPPLLIDYDFSPYMSTDVKLLEFKIKSTSYSVNETTARPYENAWFRVNITDNDTGEIISQDGVGRDYGLISKKQLLVLNSGKIRIDLGGQYGNITLTIKMRDPAKSTA